MHYTADVRAINAHSERYCGNNDHVFARAEPHERCAFFNGRQTCVKRKRSQAFAPQHCCYTFGLVTASTVDDGSTAPMAFQCLGQLLAFASFWAGFHEKVRSVKARHEDARIGHPENIQDIVACARVSRCRQGNTGDVREEFRKRRKGSIFRSEFVSPCRNAVSLVNRDQGNTALGEKVAGRGL